MKVKKEIVRKISGLCEEFADDYEIFLPEGEYWSLLEEEKKQRRHVVSLLLGREVFCGYQWKWEAAAESLLVCFLRTNWLFGNNPLPFLRRRLKDLGLSWRLEHWHAAKNTFDDVLYTSPLAVIETKSGWLMVFGDISEACE